jgi:hypothetical protein
MTLRIYADDIAQKALTAPKFFAILVLHYLRDNPFARSLRQHAGFWAKVAREQNIDRDQRRRAALMARAQLEAARYLDTLKGKSETRILP